MKNHREWPWMLLPGLGLLGFGLTLKSVPPSPLPDVLSPAQAAEKPRAYVSIQKPQAVQKPGAEETTSVQTGLHFTSRPVRDAFVRWYYNCRIEGTLHGRPHVFYASGGHDPYNCLLSSSLLSSTTLSRGVQQAFQLGRLPLKLRAGASNLVYVVEAVALHGAAAEPQEVTRGELAQARRSRWRLGYAKNSIPLSPDSSAAPRSPALLLPLPAPTPKSLKIQPLKYLQEPV